MGLYNDLLGFYSDLIDDEWDLPSGNVAIVQRAREISSIFPVKMVDLSIAMLNYQRLTIDALDSWNRMYRSISVLWSNFVTSYV